MDKLMKILKNVRDDVDFENEKSLITDGILDSFDTINIVNELNDTYNIEIEPSELLPENFDSAEAILALIERLKNETNN